MMVAGKSDELGSLFILLTNVIVVSVLRIRIDLIIYKYLCAKS